MKTIATMIAATLVVGIGSASAQVAQGYGDAPIYGAEGAFEGPVPTFGPDVLYSGRSAFVGTAKTDRTYGIGADGQGRLAPHINGIF